MKKLPILQIIIFFSLGFFILLSEHTPAYTTAEDDIQNEIDQTQEEIATNESKLDSIEAKIKEISESNYSVSQKISLLSEEISKIEEEINAKNEEIDKKLEEIAEKEKILEDKRDLLASISSDLYRESRIGSVEFFFSKTGIDELIQAFFVKKSAISVLKDEITEITGEFENLTVLKEDLLKEKEDLDTQKADLDDSHSLLLAERSKLQRELREKYNSRELISRTINGLKSELSDLQYHLLIVRQGGTNVNASSVPGSVDNYSTLAGFLANAPSNTFGVFSIGAYTHRNGMSQWGAKARAEAGQSYTQIINAYYPGKKTRTGTVVIDGKSENIMTNIKTTTYGTLNFEDDYLLRLGEMPETFPMEALKAQAIAARTYAVNYTYNGDNTICTSQSCQVVGTTKKTGKWKDAVEATRGVIMTDSSGNPFSSQYAAVHGGWSNTSGWDTTDGSSSGDWMARAYESLSGVSWFYKAWYIPIGGDSCSRYPWLTQTEMSDIVNAYQVWVANDRSDSRIVPIDDACHSSGDPYSYTELRNLASKHVSSISAVITSSSNGYTSSITFYTNAGNITMSGNDFKTIYNLRAPGHLMIPQSGFVHINIEKK